MNSAPLTISYSKRSAEVAQWMRLEQEPVSSNRLTDADIKNMLALVISGLSAKAYKPDNCEVSIIGNKIKADLIVNIWPSSLDISYTINAQLLTVEPQQALQEWHEFDLVVPMATEVDLPYLCDSCTFYWQTPTYTNRGEETVHPTISKIGNKLKFSAEIFGVLRIVCLAYGWRHGLKFEMSKSSASSISSLKPTVSIVWGENHTEQINIELPGCLEALLAMCPDGETARSHALSSSDSDEDELVPVVYYSTCSGRKMAVRYRRP